MNTEQLAARFAIDEAAISDALKELEAATAGASDDHLQEIHLAGVLPTGVLHWLLACRVKI